MRLIGELDAGEQLPFCEACAIAKSKRKAAARQALTPAKPAPAS